MSTSFNWDSIEAQWVLGLLLPEELPSLAANALATGSESRSLVELAGLSPLEAQEARALLANALGELGRGKMNKKDALILYAKDVCRLILSSELSPYEGAKRIWSSCVANEIDDFHELDDFIYGASEMEDRPEDRPLFESQLLQAARHLISQK